MNRSLPFVLCLPLGLQAQSQDYFQQQVDYTISVRLDDEAHVLHGQEAFTYTNNSPVALDSVWIHLWPNAYGQRNTALDKQLMRDGDLSLHFATAEERGRIDSLNFTTNGATLLWGYHPEHVDIAWIKLGESLVSGGSITIETPFRVKIPDSKFSRLGHTGQAYHITQWYPKPAVFDKYGWHPMPYLTQGEFYSEFGSFDVTITLPTNYVVGATGVLQEATERAWMDSLAELPYSDERKFKADFQRSSLNAFPTSDTRTKTLRYVQDKVHDFAWFADKRFVVRKGEVKLERSGRTVRTWALFTPSNSREWLAVGVEALNESVRLYSKWVGDYPYEVCTAVDGTISAGGGMEYPMITVIGSMGNVKSLDNVITHEVGHNWFYGILGSNERAHPWMDEGMNSAVELRYMRTRYPNESISMGLPFEKKLVGHITDGHRFQSEVMYRLNARRNMDQPIEECSAHYTQINYGGIVYGKSAMVFDQLIGYLGEELFDRCMNAYFEEWKFRHPQPEDVRKVFERESGKDLGWLFDELIGTTHKVDVKAGKLKGDQLTYRSNAKAGFPFSATAWRDGSEMGVQWVDAQSGKNSTKLPWADADRVRIDAGARTLDIDRRNNEVRSKGLFRTSAKPELSFLFGVEKDDRRSLYWSPLVAWNGHDGLQVGLLLNNTVLPSQRTEWVLAPLYGLGSERLGGAARIEHHFDRIESRLFQNIHLGLNLRSSSTFSDRGLVATYEKFAPHVIFDIKRDPISKPWKHSIGLRGIYLNSFVSQYPDTDPVRSDPQGILYGDWWNGELQYTASDDRKLGPTLIQATLLGRMQNDVLDDFNSNFLRGSLEVRRGFAYNKRGDQLRLRAFGGMFLHQNLSPTARLEAWGLSWGAEDLLFDHAYLERGATSGPLSKQFVKQQGAFKTPFRQGLSDDWMVSVNSEFDLPFKLPISLFASVGWVPSTTVVTNSSGTTTTNQVLSYAEAGVGFQAIRDVLEIWVPLWVSDRIADEEKFMDRSFGERIRFVFALERLDPTKALRKLKP